MYAEIIDSAHGAERALLVKLLKEIKNFAKMEKCWEAAANDARKNGKRRAYWENMGFASGTTQRKNDLLNLVCGHADVGMHRTGELMLSLILCNDHDIDRALENVEENDSLR